MKLLITGALGHIGSYVINDLLKLKKIKKIILLDNAHSDKFNVLFGLKNKKLKYLYGDLTDINFCKKIPKIPEKYPGFYILMSKFKLY